MRLQNHFKFSLLLSSFLIVSVCKAQVSGTVFRDFNANGAKTNTATYNEPFVAGIVVKAYNSTGTEVASTSTNASGAYAFTGLTLPLRIEFSGLANGDYSAASGTTNLSSVQFYTASTTSANFAVNYPEHYTSNPKLVTPIYVNGNPSASGSTPGNKPAMLSFLNTITGTAPTVNNDATAYNIGSTWGLSYNRNTKKMFAAAFLKRHTGLGSAGLGGIYELNYTTASPTFSTFLDLEAAPFNINLGTIPDNATRGLGAMLDANYDVPAFAGVGKMGLGDIDLSSNEDSLFVTDLFNRQIIVLNMSTYNSTGVKPTTFGTIALPSVTCSNGLLRPFGLKYYRGKLYAGLVCTGESSSTNSDVVMYVYAYNFSTNTWANQVTINNYNRPKDSNGGVLISWKNWTDNIANLAYFLDGSVRRVEQPTPMLSDIEFDVDGSMIIGIMDRIGHQIGSYNYGTASPSTTLYGTFSHGDILRAAYNGTTFTLENNGSVGGLTGCGVGNSSGVGNGEFYCGDDYDNNGHHETVVGGLAMVAGTGRVAATTFDPLGYDTGGIQWFSNTNGAELQAAELYSSEYEHFGKSNGLGDLELLSIAAPIEIGNRVFMDTDKDGIQDAGEMGIGSVRVELWKAGVFNSFANTDVNGQYIFTNLLPNTAYEIKILAANFPSGKEITLKDVTSGGAIDLADNDASLVGSDAVIPYTTGSAGQNNHTLDFGFRLPCNVNFTLAQSNVTCNGNANGTITITTTSGTAPYEYSLDDGATYSAPTSSTTKLYNNLAPNTYKPAVRDAFGCVKKCN